jgi:hypothetical protein
VVKTAIFGTVGIIVLCIGLYFILRQTSLPKFQKAIGRIESVSVESEERIRYFYRSAYLVTSYTPKVVYTYEVDGKEYRGYRFSLPDDFLSESYEEVEQMVRGMRKGSPVQVYYDPSEPSYSALVLERGTCDKWGMPLFLVGLAFCFLTGLFFFHERAKIEEESRRAFPPC